MNRPTNHLLTYIANQVIKQAFIANLNNEMKNLVSSSVLRNSSPTDLTAFRLETVQPELAEKAPETFHLLDVMCSSERKKLRDRGHMNDATVQDITTVDTSALNLCFSYQPGDTVTSVRNNIKTGGISDNTLQETIKAVSEAAASQDKNDLKSAIDSVLHQEQPKGYQIIGDNVDLHINVRHMSEQNKNKSLHTFNLVAMRDVVSGSNLPNKHVTTLNDVEISEFLPCHNDVEQLKKDFIVLWARVMVKNIRAFSFLKGAVIQHIQYQYSKEMQAVTEEVTLKEIIIIDPRNLC